MTVAEPPQYRSSGPRVVRFAEKYVVQTKGRWSGQPLRLEPWQVADVRELFLTRPDGSRVYNEALIGVPRKNGKSTLTAAIALYMLLASGEAGPEVYAAAASKDQARVVFNQARDFVEASPRLRDHLKPQRSVILCPRNKGVFRVLSSDAPLQYGLNPSAVVIDELWAHYNRDLYDALTSGDLARENPLTVSITTAGFDRESICWEVYQRGLELQRNGGLAAMRREGFLFRWYQAPDNCDIDDQEAWAQANPSPWVLSGLPRMRKRQPEFVFRRLHLNQWTSTQDAWIKPDQWDACAGTPRLDQHATWIAVDVGIQRDSTAIVWVQWHGEELHVGQTIMDQDSDPGFGMADVREEAGATAGRFQQLKEIAYDRWGFAESAEELEDRGLPMVQFEQNDSNMGPASEHLYELVTEGRLVHDGNTTARDQVLAAVARATERGWRISKRRSRARIDFTIALAMAAERAIAGKIEPEEYGRAAW